MQVSLGPEGQLILSIPSDISHRSHDVTIPLTVDGLYLIQSVLSARKTSTDRRIGTPAAPTQRMIEAFLVKKEQAQREELQIKYPNINLGDLKISL